MSNQLLLRRRAMMAKSLPYDIEVEYLQSNGTQYIDTGVVLDENCIVTLTGAFLSINNYIGQSTNDLTTYSCRFFIGRSSRWVSGYNGNTIASGTSNSDIHEFILNGNEGKLYMDNSVIQTFTNTDFVKPQQLNASFILFGRANLDDGDLLLYPQLIKSCSISKDGETIIDYIPVRKGNVGYFYDKVSGQLKSKIGMNDLIVGPDVN